MLRQRVGLGLLPFDTGQPQAEPFLHRRGHVRRQRLHRLQQIGIDPECGELLLGAVRLTETV
jgi:hypothetical protein